MANSGEVVTIDSDSDSDVTRCGPVTRTRNKKQSGQKNINLDPVSIDLSETVTNVPKKKTLTIEGGLDITIEDDSDEELEESIRVMWTQNVTEIKRFLLKPSETLQSIFCELSKNYNIPIQNIRLRKKDKIISMYDTVKSLNLKVTEILEAYGVDEINDFKQSSSEKIEVKCLFQTSKKPLLFYLHPKQHLNSLLHLCAQEIDCGADRLELRFDGEKISSEDTPSSLELEGGECLEVHKL